MLYDTCTPANSFAISEEAPLARDRTGDQTGNAHCNLPTELQVFAGNLGVGAGLITRRR